LDESIFDRHPFVVVSTDFIKSDRRRRDFLRTAPEFVIVDEAHSVAFRTDKRGGRHQRFELVQGLAADPKRHLVLVTATPHSGKEESFRSLLSLLNEDFADLPDDLTGNAMAGTRRKLAEYFVQRRRADIKKYADEATVFPERIYQESTYSLSKEYRRLFDKVLNYAREIVHDAASDQFRQRVRWWSALALLRSLASSPAAAAATLRNRAASADATTVEAADEIGRRTVLDLMEGDSAEAVDLSPGGRVDEHAPSEESHKRRLREMSNEAEALYGDADKKLQTAITTIKGLLKDGYKPIIFCRFIDTVDYLVQYLRAALRGTEVMGVTGNLPPSEREQRVGQLIEHDKRVLVCTDCLSEGINLQHGFDAVMHYDLSWNPTRHEQREGRVDRYGQAREEVKIVTYYSIDNQIDGIVLDVLIRKHQTIRNSLGISVPIPGDPNQIAEAVLEGLLLREGSHPSQQFVLTGFESLLQPQQRELLLDWDKVAAREKQSRTMFAQHGIKPDDVLAELQLTRAAIGSGVGLQDFVGEAILAHQGTVSRNGKLKADLRESPRGLREVLNTVQFTARFELPVEDHELYLTRTHPLVESLARYIIDTALDPIEGGVAYRAGAIRTNSVKNLTTMLLMRFRYHIILRQGNEERQLLAEDSQLIAFEGLPNKAKWLDSAIAESLLSVKPSANLPEKQKTEAVQRVVDAYETHLQPYLIELAKQRGAELLEAHRRVRDAGRSRGSYSVEAQLPPDVMGIYLFLPDGGLL